MSLQRLLETFNERGVIIGGIAVGFLGKPRFTADIDAVFLLSIKDIPQFIDRAQTEGIIPRIPDAADFARKNRVLLLKHSPTDTDIDVSLGILPFEEEMVERAKTQSFGGLSVRLPTPEDLIIMKAIAHRPKDLDDIRTIADKYPGLDKNRVKEWVRSFGDALELPGLWEQIENLLDGSETPTNTS